MIRSLTLTGATMLTAALLTGCSEQQSPTTPADTPPPSLSIDRGTTPFGFSFDDAQRQVFIGLTYEDLIRIYCTETDFDVDEVKEFIVHRPDESAKVLLRGEVNVVVVEKSHEGEVNCDDVLAAPHLTGTARVMVNDSDADFSGHGAAAIQLQVVGTVTDEAGQHWHLVAITHQVVDPSNTSSNNWVKINLTPIGG
jgi:hypothetical protein